MLYQIDVFEKAFSKTLALIVYVVSIIFIYVLYNTRLAKFRRSSANGSVSCELVCDATNADVQSGTYNVD